jgi:3-oxoacyl-[acyl-carrier protein] reductase
VLLENKNAVIYGAGGSIGGAVARAFAREGARVFLAGRTPAKLEAVAGQIRSAGGAAETAEVDALDETAVDEHAAAVAADAGGIDISFNLIAHPYTHGIPARRDGGRRLHGADRDRRAHDVPDCEGGRAPHDPAALGRDPRLRGPGDRSGPMRDYYLGGTQVAFDAIETIRRQTRRRTRTPRSPRRHAR